MSVTCRVTANRPVYNFKQVIIKTVCQLIEGYIYTTVNLVKPQMLSNLEYSVFYIFWKHKASSQFAAPACRYNKVNLFDLKVYKTIRVLCINVRKCCVCNVTHYHIIEQFSRKNVFESYRQTVCWNCYVLHNYLSIRQLQLRLRISAWYVSSVASTYFVVDNQIHIFLLYLSIRDFYHRLSLK